MVLLGKSKTTRIAICSPSKNAYSEGFIQSHKHIPNTSIKFYFGANLPTHLQGYGALVDQAILSKVLFRIRMHLSKFELSIDEYYLLRSFQKNRIQCVLAEYGTSGIRVMNICRYLQIPLIVHFHGFDASIHSVVNQNRQAYQRLFSIAKYVVVVSKLMERKILELGCPSEKIVYNVYGPHDSFFDIVPDYGSNLFVSLGRFVDKKAPYYTILAFDRVLEKHPDSKLVMGGDGYLLNSSKNLVKALGIDHAVTFPGVLSRSDFQSLLSKACGYVQHSITALNGDMEGTPNTILEASATGLPVISTFHAGIPDVVEHRKTGLLVEEHDFIGMANYMCEILDDKELARSIGLQGKERIKTILSQERYLNKLSYLVENSVNA